MCDLDWEYVSGITRELRLIQALVSTIRVSGWVYAILNRISSLFAHPLTPMVLTVLPCYFLEPETDPQVKLKIVGRPQPLREYSLPYDVISERNNHVAGVHPQH
jgi:hypothetical protein